VFQPISSLIYSCLKVCTCSATPCEPGSQYSVWLRAGRPGDRCSILGRGKRIFPLASVSRLALGPTQPPVQRILGVLSLGLKHGLGVMLTAHPHLVPKSRMSKSCTSSSPKFLHGTWWDSFSFRMCEE